MENYIIYTPYRRCGGCAGQGPGHGTNMPPVTTLLVLSGSASAQAYAGRGEGGGRAGEVRWLADQRTDGREPERGEGEREREREGGRTRGRARTHGRTDMGEST